MCRIPTTQNWLWQNEKGVLKTMTKFEDIKKQFLPQFKDPQLQQQLCPTYCICHVCPHNHNKHLCPEGCETTGESNYECNSSCKKNVEDSQECEEQQYKISGKPKNLIWSK